MKMREEESPWVAVVRELIRKHRAPLGIFSLKWEAAADHFSTGVKDWWLRESRCEEFKQPVQRTEGGTQR